MFLTYFTLLVAIALLTAGLRGRRTDDHPLCRRCGFDLTGRPDTSANCPECGVDLAAPNATRIGHRARRRGPLWAAAALTLVATVLGATDLVPRVRAIDWIHYEPAAWLLHDADQAGANQTAAFAELARRIGTGQLSASATAAAVEHALAAQADRSKPWPTGWDDLIVAAGKAGRVAPAQAQRLVEQAVTLSLDVKPRLRRGRQASLRLELKWARLPRGSQMIGSVDADALCLDRPDAVCTQLYMHSGGADGGPAHIGGYVLGSSLPVAVDAPDGSHQLFADVRFDIAIDGSFKAGPFRFAHRVAVPVSFADRDATVDTFATDPAQRSAEVAAVTQAVIRGNGDDRAWGRHGVAMVELRVCRPPVAIADDVVLVRNGREQRVGTLRVDAGAADYWYALSADGPLQFPTGSVDVVLRPSPSAADDATRANTYWGEPIVVHGVPAVAPLTAEFTLDPALRNAMTATVNLDPIVRSGESLTVYIGTKVGAAALPVTVNADVVLRDAAGHETVADSPVRIEKGTRNSSYGVNVREPSPRLTTVDVIVRPRAERGYRPAGNGLPWGEPIEFKNVPLPPAKP